MVDVFAHAPDAVLIVRTFRNKRFVYACNEAFQTLTGFKSERLIGLELASLPLAGTNPLWPIVERLCASLTRRNPEAFAESPFSLSEHAPLFGELHAKRMKATDDESFAMITIRDRSEHKWIEDAAYERDPFVSMLLTTAGTIVSLRSYRGPIHYDRLELSRTESSRFVVRQDRARVRDGLRELQDDRKTGEFRFTLQLFRDRFQVHSLVKPFYRGDGSFKCFAILVVDMLPVKGAFAQAAPPAGTADAAVPGRGEPTDSSYKLRLLMLEKRLSVTQLAENTNISLTTISNIRNGKIKKPQRLTAELIASQLGVAPSDIWSAYR
ncbi:helix-turn-helix transcriptional regulator [Paenibacillus sp. MWE-103]|uniref:Helix-turn-helix transcriptional regulator n=1 Tax=Paenibacillus artemisiicola TaxID=1172618 RepID=A0ABS3W5Z2_9BACL|nr:helix-turn-helix domain-containing protein [Paenibacillus artemisiicola]MBO7743730.1 helix-turn-helix transcriptional regulator [Paenibacillus artemisiicola]